MNEQNYKRPMVINLNGEQKRVTPKKLENIWASVQGFDKYEVNPVYGIRNKNTGKILKGRTWIGYPKVTLVQDGEKHEVRIHRVIAETFLPKPKPEYNIVNHKDGIRTNFKIHNLEWMDQSLNMKDRWANNGKRPKYVPEYGKYRLAANKKKNKK